MSAHATHLLRDGRCAACGVGESWPLAAAPCPLRHDVQAHETKRVGRMKRASRGEAAAARRLAGQSRKHARGGVVRHG